MISGLNKHKKEFHDNQRHHQCNLCGKSFKRKSHLKCHMSHVHWKSNCGKLCKGNLTAIHWPIREKVIILSRIFNLTIVILIRICLLKINVCLIFYVKIQLTINSYFFGKNIVKAMFLLKLSVELIWHNIFHGKWITHFPHGALCALWIDGKIGKNSLSQS